MRKDFPGVTHYRDRHGKLRWRYRRKGFTVNLGTTYGSPEFIRRYTAAVNGERLSGAGGAPKRVSQAPQGSLAQVINSWLGSGHFKTLSSSTQKNYRRIAMHLLDEHGHRGIASLDRRAINSMMDAKAETPEAANALLRILRLLLDHARDRMGLVEHNPAREVKKFAPKNREGYHTWTEDEITQFQEKWPEGTLADLSMALMLYTGCARADVVQLGPENIKDGRLKYYRQKMKTRGGVLVDIPLHPDLQRRIQGHMQQDTFLQTSAGKARGSAGFGNLFRAWCDKAKLPECTAHGLRKACARRLAEAGATPHEIMAVTGHKTLAEVERYTAKVGRAALADKAMQRGGDG